MRRRNLSVMEDYSPTIRRISSKLISDIFISVPGLSLVDSQNQSQTNKQEYDEKIEKNIENFHQNHKKIHIIIDEVQRFIKKRMDMHEAELIQVVRKQIDDMHAETTKIVQHYNHIINQKNKDEEVINLTNQTQYFRFQALKLFKENNRLREEIKKVKDSNKQYLDEILSLNKTLEHLTKKYQLRKSQNKELKLQLKKNSIVLDQEQTVMPSKQSFSKMLKNFDKTNLQEMRTELQSDHKLKSKLKTQTTISQHHNAVTSFSNYKVKDEKRKGFYRYLVNKK